MPEPQRCPECGKRLADANGMAMHRKAKHGVPMPRPVEEDQSMGAYWRDVREARREARMAWSVCPRCEVTYGTGTKYPPGGKCHRCGYSDA